MISVLLPVATLLIGVSFLVTGNGMQILLLPVRAEQQDFSTLSIGVMATVYYAGFAVGCLRVPAILTRVGHIRAFAALAAMAATAALLHALVVTPLAWTILRGITGFCLAGLYTTIESWLNEKAGNANRGRIFSFYMIIHYGSLTTGQLLLGLMDPASFAPFAIVCIFLCMSLVPISLARVSAPAEVPSARLRPRRLYAISPVGVIGCLTVGLVNGAFWSLAPIFAQQSMGSTAEVALFMSVAVVGGALAQWPLGRWSDRIDRRKVIIAVAAGACLSCGAVALAAQTRPDLLLFVALPLGCCIFSVYSLCVAHANDFAAADEFVEVSSGLILTFSIGAAAGPLLASAVMEWLGALGLFFFMAVLSGLFAAYALLRMSRRRAVPAEEREDFVAVPRTTPQISELDPRSHDDVAAAAPSQQDGSARVTEA